MAEFKGKYLKVWEIEDKGNVKIINLGDSRKDRNGAWENCTWFSCMFVGDASRKEINVNDKIEVTSGTIFMEKYNEKWSPKVTVFHFNVMESNQPQTDYTAQTKPEESKERFEDDIPF